MSIQTNHTVASVANKVCNKIKRHYKSRQARRKEGDYGVPSLPGLPPSILHTIMDQLPTESQAMMQLINRRLKKKFEGRHVDRKKMEPRSLTKRNILALLERDSPYPHCILCPWCCQFHRPERSRLLEAHSEDSQFIRPCSVRIQPSLEIMSPYFEGASHFLPPKVHFNMVAAIMNSHRTRTVRIPVYTPNILASTLNLPSERGIQIQVHHKLQIVGGSLLLKTEAVIYKPHHILTCGDVPEAVCLGGLFRKHRRHLRACQHTEYTPGLKQYLLCPHGGCGIDCEEKCHHHTDVDRTKDGYHAEGCHKSIWEIDSPCGWSSVSPGGKVFACPCCFTDMAVDIRDVYRENSGASSPSRAVIFTTWKDLGKGQDVKDPKWQSHLNTSDRPSGAVRGQEPTVYQAYNSVRTLAFAWNWNPRRI
ncbi:hypothetical protein ACO1O0_003383 [Amphichorda felina]